MQSTVRQCPMVWMLGGILWSYCAIVSAVSPLAHVGFNHGATRNLGYLNLIGPLPQLGSGWPFLDMRFIGASTDSREFNLGLGYRGKTHDDAAVTGVYAFYDRRRSAFDHTFQQLTLGADYLSEHLDVRLNLYLPGRESKLIEVGTPYLGPVGITRDARYEETQPGFDVEIGSAVPLISRWLETRAYLGWAQFDGDRAPDSEGLHVRLEVYPTRGARLMAGSRDASGMGRNNYVELRLSAPLGPHFLRDIGRIFKPAAAQRRSLDQRLYEPPVRDIDIVTRTSTRPDLIQPLIYVDNRSISAQEDGTLANPYHSAQPAIDAAGAGEWIYVAGGGTAYPERIQLPAGTILLGSGYRYMGVGSGIHPVFDGSGLGHVVELVGATTVMGVEVRNSGLSAAGFHARDADDIILLGNRAHHNGDGILVEQTGASIASNILIQGNDLHDNSGAGVVLRIADAARQSAALIDNRLYRNRYFGAQVEATGGVQNVRVEGNSITANGINGIWGNSRGGVQHIDLGGGDLGSMGGNRLFGNAVHDLANDTGGAIQAVNNWWGAGAPQVGRISLGPAASIDTGMAMPIDPDASGFMVDLVESPVIFVDNRNTHPTPDGSFANPYRTIAAGLAQTGTARSTVYVAAGNVPYTENLLLRDGDRLWGAHYRDLGLGGGDFPVIDGGGTHVTAASDTLVQGFEFVNATVAVRIANVDDVLVRGNSIASTGSGLSGIFIEASDGQLHQGIRIEDNDVRPNAYGVYITTQSGSGLRGIDIDGNRLTSSIFGTYIANSGGSLEAVFQRNTIAPQFAGAWMGQAATPGTQTQVDFGGGGLGSVGYNRFISGFGYSIGGTVDVTKTARYNWWGQASGPLPGQLNGSVDTGDWLISDPGP